MIKKSLIICGLALMTSASISAKNITLKNDNTKTEKPLQKAKTMTLIVGAEKPECIGFKMNGACYNVKYKKTDKKWQVFDDHIAGFNYEPGFEYVIQVKKVKIPKKDQVEGVKEGYVLVKQVSKTKKK